MFKSKPSAESITRKTAFNTTRRFGHKIVVVDTPGLTDSKKTDNEVKAEIVKSFTIASPGPHAFLLLLRPERLTPEEVKTLTTLQDFFGNDLINYLIIVFIDKEVLDRDDTTIEEYIGTVEEGNPLKNLLNHVGSRYINIGHSSDLQNPDRISEIKRIIDFAVKIKNKHGFLRSMFTDFSEAIYQRIVDLKLDLKELSISEIKDSKSKLEMLRDYARQEFLECFLGVAVNAFLRTFEGDNFQFTYELLDQIYRLLDLTEK